MARANMARLFSAHPFKFLWRKPAPRTKSEVDCAVGFVERKAADLIFNNEPDPASAETLSRVLMPFHKNGTFYIGERFNTVDQSVALDEGEMSVNPFGLARKIPILKDSSNATLKSPPFLRGEKAGFMPWAREVAFQDLLMMQYERVIDIEDAELESTAQVVAEALAYVGSDGRPLHDLIPNQNYIDYIRRIIGLYLFQDADKVFHTEREYNDISREVSLAIITDKLAIKSGQRIQLKDLHSLMVFSIFASVIGLDMKCSHCATSEISRKNTAFFYGYDNSQERNDAVWNWMRKKAADTSIFSDQLFRWNKYADLVLERPCKLVFFPDDLAETVLNLYRLQGEMRFNPDLRVTIIPRRGRFHNDASFEDIMLLLDEPCFAEARRLLDQKKLVVCDQGPRGGGVEAPKLSQKAAEAAAAADVVYINGSRSYELMATGMRKPTFGAHAISREFSTSLLGADAEKGIPCLTFFWMFPDFWGFRQRHLRQEPLFPTDRTDWQAEMTAMDSARFTSSQSFLRLVSQLGRENAVRQIMNGAIEKDLPPHRVLG
ncbi:hypothetical protein ACFL31_04920 [Candidatus Margulisiibacteriota bacterium]